MYFGIWFMIFSAILAFVKSVLSVHVRNPSLLCKPYTFPESKVWKRVVERVLYGSPEFRRLVDHESIDGERSVRIRPVTNPVTLFYP